MTKGTIGAIVVNAGLAGLAAAFGVLQGFDWTHVVPTDALWTTVAVTGINALLHYLTGPANTSQ